MPSEPTKQRVPIRELVRYYLRLGLLGFGGPVALVGQMEREMVGEKKWLTKEEMREGIAVCQSLPGPLAIQVGIWISYIRGGFWGGMGRRLGIHPAEFHHRHRAWRTLRSVRRAAGCGRHFLRSESCRHRVDPSFVLPVDQAGDEGLVGMGARRSGIRHHRGGTGRGRTGLHRLRHHRLALLWVPLPWISGRIDNIAHGCRAPCRLWRFRAEFRRTARQASRVLSESRLSHVWQRPRDRSLSGEGPRAANRLVERA